MLERIWQELALVRVYTKPKGGAPDFEEPLVLSHLRHGIDVEAAVRDISTQLLTDFNYATVWGTSTKHNPMRAGLKHILADEDVLQVNTRTNQQQRRGKDYAARCQAAFDAYHKKKKKAALKT